jgi:hypothetical protein
MEKPRVVGVQLFRGWMLRDREMQNSSLVMRHHEEDIKGSETNRGNREEVHGY